jgi:hypothetical protein
VRYACPSVSGFAIAPSGNKALAEAIAPGRGHERAPDWFDSHSDLPRSD